MMNIESFLKNKSVAVAIVILIIGITIIITFLLVKPFNDWSFNPDSELFSRYGDFIGGFIGTIFSLVAILLLYNTLIAQKETLVKQDEQLKHQKQVFEIERFESTIFNLLNTQREISNSINGYFYSLNDSLKPVTYQAQGRQFFLYSKNELHKIWLSIDNKEYLGIFDEDYIEYIQNEINELYDPNSQTPTHPDDAKAEEFRIKTDERLKYTNYAYDITKDKWGKMNKMDIPKRLKSIYGLFFLKYHYAVGHYFRHLYHILKFIDDFEKSNKGLDNISKKYIDFIQAQMSSYELMLLFYNSLSYPKLLDLIIKYDFLENLAEEDLVLKSHNCFDNIKLKKRRELISMLD